MALAKTLWRFIEILLLILGLIFLQLATNFYGRWVFEGLVICYGGYLLIITVFLVYSIIHEPPHCLEIIFLLVGIVLNVIFGLISLIAHFTHVKCEIICDKNGRIVENYMGAWLGVTCFLLALLLVADTIILFKVGHKDPCECYSQTK
ncbi:uncharacterized protein LOC130904134 [Diorhabda carinulata]|uniref:uncharacterized protein LOC130904134 n=1 Tax=Diorhabda carinulata TaxID=1163345 RepID=UPI0025A21788|nr:uncharacterized protein LOC130904134 [Diorhabda carinulata]